MRIEGYIRGVCLLLIPFIYGMISGGTNPFLIFYICLSLVVVDLLWTLNSSKITIGVDADSSSIQTGAKTGLFLEVNNPTRWPVPWVQCLIDLPGTFALEGNTGCYNLSLKSFERKVMSDSFLCNLRGNYKWGAALIRSGGILGIFSVTKFVPIELELEVLPRFLYIGKHIFSMTAGHPNGLQAGKIRALRQGSDSAGFLGIRAYNSADDFSKIHWKASARMNGLYVKEFGESKKSDFVIYLDNGENFLKAESVGKDFEMDITITASVIATLIKSGHGTGFVSSGNTEYDTTVRIGRGLKHFRTQLKQLARVAPVKGAVLRDELARVASGWPPGIGIILITRHLDDASAKLLGRLKSRGYNCTVLLVTSICYGTVLDCRKTGYSPAAEYAIPVIALNQDNFGWVNRGA